MTHRHWWAPLAFISASAGAQESDSLLDLSIEELSRVQVTTVSRRVESRSDAAASIFVITRDEILRAGVRSLPEALRLAPGVEVARNGSSNWSITMRGFNSDITNKLLVLIDGRSVYSPLYAGVFWDAQDVSLEDIERIEVIAGPGGTLWGANAVNGVINVITRSTWETEGGSLRVGAGNELEVFGSARYSGRIGGDVAWRGYIEHTEFDAVAQSDGSDAPDGWQRSQGGFRFDANLSSTDTLKVQGDVYDIEKNSSLLGDFTLGTLPEILPGTVDVGGHNVLARWRRQLERGASLRLQGYFDHTDRNIPGTYHEKRDTFDLDFQHQLPLLGRHAVVWGAGVRVSRDNLSNSAFARFDPAERTDRTYSFFTQDRIQFLDGNLQLTLGSKFEHNDYTGFEYQPSARLAWLFSDRQTFWAALSRAVRIPARLNEDLSALAPIELPGLAVPLYLNIVGDRNFASEDLLAKEIGYRVNVRQNLSFDVTMFEHDYANLATNEAGTPIFVDGPGGYILLPVVQGNNMGGDSYGVTFAANWKPIEAWRLEWQYSYLGFDLEAAPESTDSDSLQVGGNSPRHQLAVQSFVDLPHDLSLYAGIRRVDELPNLAVPAYTAVDASLAWRPSDRLRAALTVRNLNDDRHLEFGGGTQIERSAYVTVRWSF